jgi:nucleotide-binding universal stress UspA family protein
MSRQSGWKGTAMEEFSDERGKFPSDGRLSATVRRPPRLSPGRIARLSALPDWGHERCNRDVEVQEASMNVRPSVLCPVDCSDTSLAALRYATAIAEHFVTRLIVLSVVPADEGGGDTEASRDRYEQSLSAFVQAACGGEAVEPMYEVDVAYGTPSVEIFRVARERSCDLIVVSSAVHGLRDQAGGRLAAAGAAQPILVISATRHGGMRLEDIRRQLQQIVTPAGLFSDYVRAVIAMAAA